jgi:hypothetical protein
MFKVILLGKILRCLINYLKDVSISIFNIRKSLKLSINPQLFLFLKKFCTKIIKFLKMSFTIYATITLVIQEFSIFQKQDFRISSNNNITKRHIILKLK